MRIGSGGSVGDYRAPLFVAWQLTNRCRARCLHCCEESGPDAAWRSELNGDEAKRVARDIAGSGAVEVAFGGGEPLGAPYVWAIFDILVDAGVALKIETDGLFIDDAAADRLADLRPECIQISVDGATPETHARLRPGGDFRGALDAVRRLSTRGLGPEVVFVPTRLNAAEAADLVGLAAKAGARRVVTGPLMRLGRAGQAWSSLALSAEAWGSCETQMRARSEAERIELVAYPHDIVEEVRQRLREPQAMILIVPDGSVKLLNALPFSCGNLRQLTVAQAWGAYLRAWRDPAVAAFCDRLSRDPDLLKHANEVWPVAAGNLDRLSASN